MIPLHLTCVHGAATKVVLLPPSTSIKDTCTHVAKEMAVDQSRAVFLRKGVPLDQKSTATLGDIKWMTGEVLIVVGGKTTTPSSGSTFDSDKFKSSLGAFKLNKITTSTPTTTCSTTVNITHEPVSTGATLPSTTTTTIHPPTLDTTTTAPTAPTTTTTTAPATTTTAPTTTAPTSTTATTTTAPTAPTSTTAIRGSDGKLNLSELAKGFKNIKVNNTSNKPASNVVSAPPRIATSSADSNILQNLSMEKEFADLVRKINQDEDKKIETAAKNMLEQHEKEPWILEQTKLVLPEAVECIVEKDLNKLVSALKAKEIKRVTGVYEQQKKVRAAMQNPLSADSQEVMYNLARQSNRDDMMKKKEKLVPNHNMRTHMLYLPVIVEGKELDAFVDTGAQVSIITEDLVESMGLEHLIDTRFASVAVGVGVQSVKGVIHVLPVTIGNKEYNISLSVMPKTFGGNSFNFLVGLDLLRKYKCSIDLSNDSLIIDDNSVAFLTHDQLVERKLIPAPKEEEDSSPSRDERGAARGGAERDVALSPEEEAKEVEAQTVAIIARECSVDISVATSVYNENDKDMNLTMTILKSMNE